MSVFAIIHINPHYNYKSLCIIKSYISWLELNLGVPLEDQAKDMCDKWKDSSQDIYDFIMHRLL